VLLGFILLGLSFNGTVLALDASVAVTAWPIVPRCQCAAKVELLLDFGTLKIEYPGSLRRLIRPPKT
jgi:hypothetical protein